MLKSTIKITSVLLLFLGCSVLGTAQEGEEKQEYQSSPLLPKSGSIGVSISIDGILDNIKLDAPQNNYGQNQLFVRYYLEDDLALRLGFGFDFNGFKRERADSAGTSLVERDSTYNNYILNVSGGIEKHLMGTNRLDPYLFTQMDLSFIGKTNIDTETRTINSAGTDRVSRTIKEDGGIAFGLQIGGGFNYFIAQRLSLGTEIALKLNYASVGGASTNNLVNDPANGSTTTTVVKSDDQSNSTDFDVNPNLNINLSYFF